MTIVHFKHLGFYMYASTEEILKRALHLSGFQKYFYENIPIDMGEILKIQGNGALERSTFDTEHLTTYEFGWYDYGNFVGTNFDCNPYDSKENGKQKHGTYLELLIDYAGNLGISEEEILLLVDYGFEDTEIEDLLYDPAMFQCCVEELLETEQQIF